MSEEQNPEHALPRPRWDRQNEPHAAYSERREAYAAEHRRLRSLRPSVTVERTETVLERETVVQPVEMDEAARREIAELRDTVAWLLIPGDPEPAPVPDPHNFPANLSDKLSDWDTGADENNLTTADLTEDVIQRLTKDKRKKFTELLNVELAELQQERGGPREALSREAEIEKLLGLFARVGEM
jgi:hypothetical protein